MIINSKDIFLDVKSYTLYIDQEPFLENVLNTYIMLEITTHDNKIFRSNISESDDKNIGYENHLELLKNKVFTNILDQISNNDEVSEDIADTSKPIEFIDENQTLKKTNIIPQRAAKTCFLLHKIVKKQEDLYGHSSYGTTRYRTR